MVAWGSGSVVASVATDYVSPEVPMVVSYATGGTFALGYVVTRTESVEYSTRGLGVVAVAGVFAGLGAVAFSIAWTGEHERRDDGVGAVLRGRGRARRPVPERIQLRADGRGARVLGRRLWLLAV